MTFLLNGDKIAKIISEETITPLSSELEIEDFILVLKQTETKIDFLKRLKKDRVTTIDKEIVKFNSRKDILRSVILETLKDKEIKSLDFPGVGRVSQSVKKGKWNIEDQESLMKELRERLSEQELDKVVATVAKIKKKEVDKLFNQWEKSGVVPSCVLREDSETSLSVTIDKNADLVQDINDDVKRFQPNDNNEVSLDDDLDGLDF